MPARSGSRTKLVLRLSIALAVAVALAAGIVVLGGHQRRAAVADQQLGVTIVSPASGSVVTNPVRFTFEVRGAQLGSPEAGLDHLHVSIDGSQPGGVETNSVTAVIPPGRHFLHVELADAAHDSLGVSADETFTVAASR
ncbi:hypothetical protein EPN52_06635 [bacterium]|nr:MAG: hypothetical protein EPN52_06635 [bacterium]